MHKLNNYRQRLYIKDGYLTFTAYDDNNTAYDVEISRDEVLNMARFLNDNHDLVISDRELKDNSEETQYFAQEVLEGWQRSTNKDEWSVIVKTSKIEEIQFSRKVGKMLDCATYKRSSFIENGKLDIPFITSFMKKNGFTKYELI
jgi:hypothetical protein